MRKQGALGRVIQSQGQLPTCWGHTAFSRAADAGPGCGRAPILGFRSEGVQEALWRVLGRGAAVLKSRLDGIPAALTGAFHLGHQEQVPPICVTSPWEGTGVVGLPSLTAQLSHRGSDPGLLLPVPLPLTSGLCVCLFPGPLPAPVDLGLASPTWWPLGAPVAHFWSSEPNPPHQPAPVSPRGQQTSLFWLILWRGDMGRMFPTDQLTCMQERPPQILP